MALILRQSTAVDVLIGPFVDSTDGVTAETALTISQADVLLSKNGQALAQKSDATAASHDASGYYNCELDATDTATVGTLVLAVSESGALPVRHEFQVIEEAAYDAMYAASAVGPLLANSNGSGLTEAGGTGDHLTAVPWNAAWDAEVQSEVTDALNAYDPPTNAEMEARTLAAASYATAANQTTMDGKLDTIDTVVDAIQAVTDNLPDSGALTSIAQASALATVDGNVDAILVDTGTTLPARLTGIEGATFDTDTDSLEAIRNRGDAAWTGGGSAPTVGQIADAVWDEVLSGHTTEGTAGEVLGNVATGTPPSAEAIRQEIDANSTQLAAIVADTGELQTDWANGGRLDLILDARASQSSVDTIDGNVDSVLTDTGTTLPATLATIAGYIDTEVAAILEDTGTTIPGLIAALNNLSQADIRTAVGLASANLDTQLAALPTAAENRAEMDSNSTQLAAIVADTNELQTDDVPGLIGALNNFDPSSDTVTLADGGITAAKFGTGAIDAAALADDAVEEIRDAIGAEELPELTADPGATPTRREAEMLTYMSIRNRRDTTALSDEIHNDAGSVILEAALSDDGTVFTKGEYAAP